MNLYKDISTWKEDWKILNCIIEINKWSMVKYELNKEKNVVEVDRFFTTPMPIPYNYWLIPNTYNKEDKDPLDAIILSEYSIQAWTLCSGKVIWILHMVDWWEMDDKVIVIPEKEPYYSQYNSIEELPQILKSQIEFFLSNYKEIDWKETKVTWWSWIEEAIKTIKESEI